MLNERLKAVTKVALLALFISYACSITFFTHTHIVNGVTIVHSHPYMADDDGSPGHEHTGAEIQLIHTLSVFFVAGVIIPIILSGIFRSRHRIIFPATVYPIYKRKTVLCYRLRPPPAL